MTFILASNYREAVAVAASRGLARSEWRYLGREDDLRGMRGVTVLRTSCAYDTKGWMDVRRIDLALRWADASVVWVDCA